MNKKKTLTLILAVLMLGLFAGAVQAASPSVVLDGQELTFDVAPAIDNGRTMVPLRAIFEALGADVEWDSSTRTVTATRGTNTIRLQIGNATAYRNGEAVSLDVPGKIIQDRTMVPLRFVGEALDCLVEWNGPANRVEISSPGEAVAIPVSAETKGFVKAHIIDVGQGDSILIQLSSGKNVLIDAGTDSTPVITYLNQNNITRLDVVIATHPHSDHIGGMEDIVKTFDVDSFYMPRVNHTTQAFEDMVNAVINKGLKAKEAKAGVNVDVGEGFNAYFVAPNSAYYEDINNYSAVLKLEFGETGFLFTGDAEDLSEEEMLCTGYDLQSDVLKVGHHGSNSSSTTAFLNAVQPDYAIISVGEDNDYGHPSAETLSRLQDAGAQVYRTDQQGTVIVTSDGADVTVNKQAGAVTPVSNKLESTIIVAPASDSTNVQYKYIGNKNSKKFHLPTCSSLPNPENRVYFSSREEAISQGYTPCGRCKP